MAISGSVKAFGNSPMRVSSSAVLAMAIAFFHE
jgi:hypothetical protein